MTNKSGHPKLYSTKNVLLGSIVGGPWAATYFFYKNLQTIGQKEYAKRALLIGGLSPLLFVGLSLLIPLKLSVLIVYALCVVAVTFRYQTAIARAYNSKNPNDFYSDNKASLATVLFMVLYLIFILGANVALSKINGSNYSLLEVAKATIGMSTFDSGKYNEYLKTVTESDATALQKMTSILTSQSMTVAQAQTEIAAAKSIYESNKTVISDMISLSDTPENLKKQNEYLQKYTDLRLQQVALLEKSINENTDKYMNEVTALGAQIDALVKANKQ